MSINQTFHKRSGVFYLKALWLHSPWSCQRPTAASCHWWGISPQRCLLAATIACAPPWSPRTSRRKKVPRSPRAGSAQTHKHVRCWVARRKLLQKLLSFLWQGTRLNGALALPGCHERQQRCPPQSTSHTFLWDSTGWEWDLNARQTNASFTE